MYILAVKSKQLYAFVLFFLFPHSYMTLTF